MVPMWKEIGDSTEGDREENEIHPCNSFQVLHCTTSSTLVTSTTQAKAGKGREEGTLKIGVKIKSVI